MPNNTLSSAGSGSLLEDYEGSEALTFANERAEKESKLQDVRDILHEAATGRDQYLHPDTAERWFQETVDTDRPRSHFEQQIRPRMKEAQATRQEYDDVTQELKKRGSSFDALAPDAFWKLSSNDRKKYLEQAREYMKGPKNFESRWGAISDKVRNFVKITFDELGAASSSESKALLEGLKYKPQDEKELEGWEEYVNGEMQKQLKFARRLYFEELMDPLLRELKNKTISERVLKEMDKKFRDKNVDYKSKETYIQKVLPTRIKEWQTVKAKRDGLAEQLSADSQLKRLVTKRVGSSKTGKLNAFMNPDAFAKMTYPERKGITDLIDSIIKADKNNMLQLHGIVHSKLESFSQDGRMHPSKVGTWMDRIFTHHATPQEVQAYLTNTVYPNAERWKQARVDFDALNAKIKQKGLPRGMHQNTLNQFLLMDYEQRVSYLEEATQRMEHNVNEQSEINNLILGIRHNFDTHDWEEAEELLNEAKALDPENRAVQSMDRYLRAHRPRIVEEKEDLEAEELVTDLRMMLKNIPGMMGKTYERAMLLGSQELSAITTGAYNLVWVHEHRYSTPQKDRIASESDFNKDKTRNYIEDGHSRKLEHNILGGDTAHPNAIRDECKKAQMVHIQDKEGAAVTVDKFKQKQDDKLFLYWTTLHFDDVSYEEHRRVVRNYNYPLKTKMRALDKMGYKFTLDGAPQKKD
ncbi:hypothetical protein K8942_04530 [Candidatus Peribacteria bacterium]|nr:MAG: hypothetical protein K8942_04530 [Candidatus Peribacteria bacterium]